MNSQHVSELGQDVNSRMHHQVADTNLISVANPDNNEKIVCMLCVSIYSKDSVSPICNELGICKHCYTKNVAMLKTIEDTHVKPYIAPDHVIGNIYIGPDNSALDSTKLKSLGMTHILVAGNHLHCRFPEEFTYMKLDIDDSLEEDILRVIDRSMEFIHSVNNQNKGNILVHCASGISRSASLMIAYLMRHTDMKTLEDAYNFLHMKRSKIHPNTNFIRQLKQYEDMLKGFSYPIG